MPSLDCPTCKGTGYVQQDDDATIICARCDGTGVLFVDEDAVDTWIGAEG
jgi:DnaJ-class molecular chaperone